MRVPTRGFGDRRVFCPSYDDCLDETIKSKWHAFNCGSCPESQDRTREKQRLDIEGTRRPRADHPSIAAPRGLIVRPRRKGEQK